MIWRKGWIKENILGRMDALKKDHPVHTTPNQTKLDVFPKTFLQVILGAKWIVWHSIPSLLSDSYSIVHTDPLCPGAEGGEMLQGARRLYDLRDGRQGGGGRQRSGRSTPRSWFWLPQSCLIFVFLITFRLFGKFAHTLLNIYNSL